MPAGGAESEGVSPTRPRTASDFLADELLRQGFDQDTIHALVKAWPRIDWNALSASTADAADILGVNMVRIKYYRDHGTVEPAIMHVTNGWPVNIIYWRHELDAINSYRQANPRTGGRGVWRPENLYKNG